MIWQWYIWNIVTEICIFVVFLRISVEINQSPIDLIEGEFESVSDFNADL